MNEYLLVFIFLFFSLSNLTLSDFALGRLTRSARFRRLAGTTRSFITHKLRPHIFALAWTDDSTDSPTDQQQACKVQEQDHSATLKFALAICMDLQFGRLSSKWIFSQPEYDLSNSPWIIVSQPSVHGQRGEEHMLTFCTFYAAPSKIGAREDVLIHSCFEILESRLRRNGNS